MIEKHSPGPTFRSNAPPWRPVTRRPELQFLVDINVNIPPDADETKIQRLKEEERLRAQELQRQGVWLHLWRVAGRYQSVSVFDVDTPDELHRILSSLPLFPYLDIAVTALARHPSAL